MQINKTDIDSLEEVNDNIPLVELEEFTVLTYDYDIKYCAMIIKHCQLGFSIESFCGKHFISPSTMTRWANTHKEFYGACEAAACAQLHYLELQQLEAMKHEGSAYKLPTINRMLIELGGVIYKNPLRKSLFGDYQGNKEDTPEEGEVKQALDTFVEK